MQAILCYIYGPVILRHNTMLKIKKQERLKMNNSNNQAASLSQSSGKDLHLQFIEQLRKEFENADSPFRCTGTNACPSSTITRNESFPPDNDLRKDLEIKKKRIFGSCGN